MRETGVKHLSVNSGQLVVIVTRRTVSCLYQVTRHLPPDKARSR